MTSSALERPARVAFITHRFEHHSDHSGYDRLLDFVPGERLDPGPSMRVAKWIPDRVFAWIRRASGMDLYHRPRVLHEIRAMVPFLFGAKRLFCFLYADNGYRYLGRLPNFHDHRIVAVYHRPPSELSRLIRNPEFLRDLDRVIILGESQRAFFEHHVDPSRITFVPHGIDTDYFRPDDGIPRQKRCLFVGHFLRDFEALREAVPRLVALDPTVRVTVVARPRFADRFAGLPKTEVRMDVSEAELRDLYRRSAVLLLPLRDAVANNTILEALACGLPVVTTDVGAVRDYLNADAGSAVPAGRPELLAEAAAGYLADPDRLAAASVAARQLAVTRFELRSVSARFGALLNDVATAPARTRS
jgi:glycosyltransferase involved in cell wall biosynthesis